MRIATSLAVVICAMLMAAQPLPAQRGPANVDVAKIVEREVASGQTFVGTVMPIKRSVIGSAVGGRVAEFPVNEGDFVRARQPLAQLLTNTINLEVDSEKATLDLRKEELNELVNGTRPDEIKRAKALMMAAKADSEYQQKRLKRLESLYARKAVNDDDIQAVVSESIRAEEMFSEAEAAYKRAVEGPRKEQIAQAKARVAVQQALVDKLESQVVKHTIISPFDGYVVAEHTEVGQWVNSGELVAEVIALDHVDVSVQVLENHVPHVQLKSEVRLKALMVSKDALVLGGPTPMIYVVEPGKKNPKLGKARAVPVQVGVADGRLIQVKGDLESGGYVVIRGNERLRPGQDVMISNVLEPDALPTAKAINTDG